MYCLRLSKFLTITGSGQPRILELRYQFSIGSMVSVHINMSMVLKQTVNKFVDREVRNDKYGLKLSWIFIHNFYI